MSHIVLDTLGCEEGWAAGRAQKALTLGKRTLMEWNVNMHITAKQKNSIPPGARGLILFWILSFPMALAAMVYALGML